ncbi:MAG: PspC domain-containing protein [Prevotellaceae bacterium]|jgi:phage shock protein C|nr:PspC domain-containing protein [Prevotellaceae bacterium]MDY3856546.1 PspC domain-containing protein [Bacteroidaceae bacterium]
MKELRRDLSNKMLGGVCSGIARYLNVDPTVIRLLWVLSLFLIGTGILAYLICWIVIPADY